MLIATQFITTLSQSVFLAAEQAAVTNQIKLNLKQLERQLNQTGYLAQTVLSYQDGSPAVSLTVIGSQLTCYINLQWRQIVVRQITLSGNAQTLIAALKAQTAPKQSNWILTLNTANITALSKLLTN